MSHEMIIENIKTKLSHIEPVLLNSIWEIVEHAERRQQTPIPREPVRAQALVAGELHFIGENLRLEEYERLSRKQRAALQLRLKEQNFSWLKEQFAKHQAAWLIVVDGKAAKWGESLQDRPLAQQNVEISQQTGKFPFVFVNDEYLAMG
ncbi:MAG: hypothetical protein AAB354_16840 [candidate division KSB1 bacterium]